MSAWVVIRERRLLIAVLVVVAAVHAPALGQFFAVDDWYGLDVFHKEEPRELLSRFPRVFTAGPGSRLHPVPASQYWLGSTLFGAFYPGHMALLLAAHLVTTLTMYGLVKRIVPGDTRAAPMAALLFGIAPVTGATEYLAAGHHVFLALGLLSTALCYEAFMRRPSASKAAQTLLASVLAATANEAGALAAASPVFLELGALTAGNAAPSSNRRGRTALTLACVLVGCFRLRPIFTARVLSGEVPLEGTLPNRYTVSLAPEGLISRTFEIMYSSWALPPTAGVLLITLCAAGLFVRRSRQATVFGLAAALAMALPMSALSRPPSPWYAYAPSAGIAIAAAVAALAGWDTLKNKLPRAVARVVGVLLLGLTLTWAVVHVRTAGTHRRNLARIGRSVTAGLVATVPTRGPPLTLVIHGTPANPARPMRPLMLHRAVSYLLGDRGIASLVIVVPALREPMKRGTVQWVPTVDASKLPHGPRYAYRFRDGALYACEDLDCSRLGKIASH
jgi:hypothetical protein